MQKKFETPAFEKVEVKEKKGEKEPQKDLNPQPETIKKHEQSLEKQKEVREREVFCTRLDTMRQDFKKVNVKAGENDFSLSLENIKLDGKDVKENDYGKLKQDVEKGSVNIGRISGTFTVTEAKGGVNFKYDLPVSTILTPNGLQERLVNDFSGGTSEYYKKAQEVPVPKEVDKPKTAETGKEKERKEQQTESVKKAAAEAGGSVSVLSGKGLTSLIITYPKGKQLRMTTTETAALWSATESDNGKMTDRGARENPMEFLPSPEKEPGQ